MTPMEMVNPLKLLIPQIFPGRLENEENHAMHTGLNNIWDEFSSNKNRDSINPILDVSWTPSDLF